jgi:electron transport complex protein RnfB
MRLPDQRRGLRRPAGGVSDLRGHGAFSRTARVRPGDQPGGGKKSAGQRRKGGTRHTSSNSQDRATFICNCCPCCCTILRGLTQLNLPHPFATSGFQAEVNPDSCNGCGICADERCPVGAIELQDDIAVVTAAKCIGCGLCVTACPTEALSLVRRDPPPEIPATAQEMGMKVLTEKGKLEAFMAASKR